MLALTDMQGATTMNIEMTWTRSEDGGLSATWTAKPEAQSAAATDAVRADAMAPSAVATLWQPISRRPKQVAVAA
jgi:hypothetical protein